MADTMATVEGYGCISGVYLSFEVLYHIAFRRMPASMLDFLVGIINRTSNFRLKAYNIGL